MSIVSKRLDNGSAFSFIAIAYWIMRIAILHDGCHIENFILPGIINGVFYVMRLSDIRISLPNQVLIDGYRRVVDGCHVII